MKIYHITEHLKKGMEPFAETLNPFPIYIPDTEINVIVSFPKSSPSPYYFLQSLISHQ